jgi:hypothetical protein
MTVPVSDGIALLRSLIAGFIVAPLLLPVGS